MAVEIFGHVRPKTPGKLNGCSFIVQVSCQLSKVKWP
jgi:hypothetical protein